MRVLAEQDQRTRLGVCVRVRLAVRVATAGVHMNTTDAEMYEDGNPGRDVLDRIGDKWTILVMRALQEESPLRYTELLRRIPSISRKMLTQTLRGIEYDGIVARHVYPVIPPRVEYTLTDLGESALLPIDALCTWSRDHMHEVVQARARFLDEAVDNNPERALI